MTQDEAFSILRTGANVFLTGEPGSGKTHTLNRYISYLRSCGVEPSVTASTGIAATHIGGMTIHSWSGIGVRQRLSAYDLDNIAGNKRVATRLSVAHVLIIDEVSMLSVGMLDMVDAVCREVRGRQEPFGGLQVIFVGDFFQLPPIVKKEENSEKNQSLLLFEGQKRESRFAFGSGSWQKANPIVCYLSEQHRQEDAVFLEFLSAIRCNLVRPEHKNLLRARYRRSPDKDDITELYTHNANVDRINEVALGKLPGEPAVFVVEGRGPDPLISALKRGCLSPEILSLKIGARVMFTKNDYIKLKFVNGTTGVIAGFSKDRGFPIVKTTSGKTIEAEPAEWAMQDNGRVLARIIQIPLRLAWAVTVHKSQGMSLDAAHMDLSSAFEYGQGYVALSRVRTLEGLTLSGLNDRALMVHPEILQKDEIFRAAAKTAHATFGSIDGEKLRNMHRNFIHSCGGDPSGGHGSRTAKKNKPSTYVLTRGLIARGYSIEEAARERGMTIGTILNHLEKLVSAKNIDPQSELAHCKIADPRFAKIETAFRTMHTKTGEYKLTPVRDLLGDDFTFEELRLARLFL